MMIISCLLFIALICSPRTPRLVSRQTVILMFLRGKMALGSIELHRERGKVCRQFQGFLDWTIESGSRDDRAPFLKGACA